MLNATAQYDIRLHAILLIICSFFIAVVAIAIKNTKDKRFFMTRILNLMSVFLLIFPTFVIAEYKLNEPFLISSEDYKEKLTNGNEPEVIGRDIYFIVLDGYARYDTLKEFYGFDNSDFISYLKQKGFFVANQSHSNYAWTHLSLPSMLNYEYVNYLTDKIGENSKDLQIPFQMIENNRAVKYLKSQGYYFVFFNSTWHATKSNKNADLCIRKDKSLFCDEFTRVLAETTMLKLFNSIIARDLAEWHLYTFEMLEKMPDIDKNTFTFAHIILPHHPYIFDREGKVRKKATMVNQFQPNMWRDTNGYIEQLIFVNDKVKNLVNVLLEKSDVKPIIILLSDHGPQIRTKNKNTFIQARMSNLVACFLPDKESGIIYDSITPVNIFRIIFNSYFGTDYDLLEDKLYYSEYVRPYKFVDVTIPD